MLQVDTGFTSTNVMTAWLPIARDRFAHPEQLVQYVRLLDERLRAAPGVRDVGFSNVLPMRGWGDGMPFLIAGRPFVDRANRRACFYKRVTSSYFRTLDIHLIRGRTFTDSDTRGGAPVTVINEEMAKRYFKGEDPIGKRILIQEILYGLGWGRRSLGKWWESWATNRRAAWSTSRAPACTSPSIKAQPTM
jgi:putative ABC transport system permease protein